jgi:hypothetical protein
MGDLELMHFYCTESYKSLAGFAGRADTAYILRWDTVPKLAFAVHDLDYVADIESRVDACVIMFFGITSKTYYPHARDL